MGRKSFDKAVTRSGTHRNQALMKSLDRVTLLPALKRDARAPSFARANKNIDITMYSCP
jgi:hypothetical protein